MEEQGQQKVSKYNSGVANILRLDELWKKSASYTENGLYSKWNIILDVIWTELAGDIDEKDYKSSEEKFEKFEKRILALGQINDSGPVGFQKATTEQINNRSKQYKILIEKTLFLRRLQNKLGKGTAYEDEEDDDI